MKVVYWIHKDLRVGGLRVQKLLPLLLPALAVCELSQLRMQASFPEAGGEKDVTGKKESKEAVFFWRMLDI